MDQTISPAIQYTLKDIRTSLKNISNDGKTPIDFDAGLTVAQGGSAHISGQLSQTGDHVTATVKLTGLNLKPLQPAVAEFTTLALESGSVSASADLTYQSAKSGPRVRAGGRASVDHLRLTEAGTGDRVLEWKSLSFSGMDFGLSPDRLKIKKINLVGPGAKMMVYKDRGFNLAQLKKDRKAEAIPDPPASASSGRASFPVSIDSVRVENGTVDFSDLSLIFPFATRVTDLTGGISGIASTPESRSAVQFEGRVDKFGMATVNGSMSPFAPKTFTDLKVIFKNVKMTPLSPYTATFAGRKISSGALNLDLEYKINNSELLGKNSVILDQFSLGERVEAPDAVSLPLDLAIALLTDTQGQINVAVPVSGNLDDPKFSYGHVVWQAIFNLITKAVTAPFRALGNLFGGDSEQVDAIAFNPGSHQLPPPEQEKLQTLAQALEKRPQLKLMVLGRFDTELDGKALRTKRVKRALAAQMDQPIPEDQAMPPLVFDMPETRASLEKLLETQGGDTAILELQDRYKKATGMDVDPTKPEPAFYQAIFDELVTLAPLGQEALLDLAQKRAQAIATDIETVSGLDKKRLTIGEPAQAEKPSSDTVKTRLQLDVLKPPAN